ncbi:GNAT family N-acetyltransferase [Methylobrevis pamukkalensis]|uniref:Acetyltransferase (GNAT) family protein n=1 Tax=Methylobrevis pamukkalensis TaxID=1439726 RepID=A0A1E3H278_9HYPH|nr:N-acetyltransferase [Methylobrevis pamukkalensis]ODN69641.1 Acetyltransferase (GNAT) family protein [Methylobrevis pamukkalensis]
MLTLVSPSLTTDASLTTPAAPAFEPAQCRPERPADDAAIEAIHDITFGPGRYARTAFRLREGVAQDMALSLVAEREGKVVASVRLTPIRIGETPALLLGPLAVLPHLKSQGIGKMLMRRSMEAARLGGHRLVLLVGDLPYYWPFGFRAVPQGRLVMPGPVDPGRLLVAELAAGAFEGVSGTVHRGAG